MGFGEKFPIDNVTKNDFRSQSNRRVEIMMFDDGEEPDLAAAATNPEGIETYLPGMYGKVAVKPMLSGKRAAAIILNMGDSAPWAMDARMQLIAEDLSVVSDQAVADGEPFGIRRIYRFRGPTTGTVCRIAVVQDRVAYYLSDWLVIRDASFVPLSFTSNSKLATGIEHLSSSTPTV
jgi:hypothetical protein